MSFVIAEQLSRIVNDSSEEADASFLGTSVPRSSERPVPLSFAQEQVWLDVQRTCGIPLCNRILLLRHTGPLDLQALNESFQEIIGRHEIFRATFATQDGAPVQVITNYRHLDLPITDLSVYGIQEHEAHVLRIAAEEERFSFDLSQGPLMRARLLRSSEQDHYLLIAMHPLLADEPSMNILAQELNVLNQAHSVGEQAPLTDLPFQYGDFARFQRAQFQGEVLQKEISYWRKRLTDIPPVFELPIDRPRSSVQLFQSARHTVLLPNNVSKSLHMLSEEKGVTLAATLLAAFEVLLFRHTGQDDIVLGLIVAGRDRTETEGLIGPFSQITAIRLDLGKDPTFDELLRRVSDISRADNEHRNLPWERVINELQPERDLSRNPLFRVLFSVTPGTPTPQSCWERANVEGSTSRAQVDLQLAIDDKPQGFEARFTYDTELFDDATIRRMAGHFQTLLEGVIANPRQSISRLPLLTPAERDQLLVEWNNTYNEYPNRCVHQLFEEQVDRTPDATVLVFENQQLTYRELNNRANRVAHHLSGLGVYPDALVGICAERCPDMIAGLLGILKAGGAYVPLDPRYPSDRLALMLEDSELKVLVTQTPLRPKFHEFRGQLLCVDSATAIREESGTNFCGAATPENLAYVIYTSGSTGKPKGVQISHRNLVNFLASVRSRPGLAEDDTLVAVTTISFDIAALELYLPLIVGARLVLASSETAGDGYKLQTLLPRTDPTVMQATPATWRLLLEAGWQGGSNLKILCGGEAMPRDVAAQLLKRASSVWNMYGPTETTVWSTISEVTHYDGPITIGKPIANTEVYVLDRHLEPVPVGVPGELCIGGAGVARGYLHRPELTAEKFIPHPFRDQESGERLYRTGDLARYRANGEIECLGRTDNQVKVRGFRIELGEIESALNAYPGVKQNVVVAREDTPGDKRLVAYLTVSQFPTVTSGALRDHLKRALPDYMLPSRFVFLDGLPLTPNGKVDRKVLPKPEENEFEQPEKHVAPRDDIESRLVKIWTSVLRTRTVGIQDNFFELGGHSLLVAKLIHRIDQEFGKQLSMAAVFEAPTIERQAILVSNGDASQNRSAVIPIQPRGSKPPFFCFGVDAGPIYLPLARHLGAEQPIFCVGLTPSEARQLPLPLKLEDIAGSVVKRVRERQPEGPYYLGGFCTGGLMAYEAARQIVAQGQEVALLALIEPQTPNLPSGNSTDARSDSQRERLRFHLANLKQLRTDDWRGYVHDRFLRTLLLQARGLHLLVRKNHRRVRDLGQILYLATRNYHPDDFPGRVVLFQATNRPRGSDWEREYWRKLAATLEVHAVPGYSNWVVHSFVEPNVAVLAESLKNCFANCAWPKPVKREVALTVEDRERK
ncbi:MAG: non-ribosomal peptide synthetase [Bryobacteraceae bacterium]